MRTTRYRGFRRTVRTATAAALALFAAQTIAPRVHAGDGTELLPAIPSDTGLFGAAVALDGDRLVVGSPLVRVDDAYRAGVVDVFERIAGEWTFRQRIVPPVLNEQARFGATVAMDGPYLVVGAPDARFGTGSKLRGRTWVWTWNGTEYTSPVELDPAATNPGARWGWAIAIDGDRIACALPSENSGGVRRGAVTVHERSGSAWPLRARIRPDESSFASRPFLHGYSVALSGDLLVIGAPFGPDEGAGSATRWGQVWIRRRASQTSWPIEGRVNLDESLAGEFGELGVSVATDGQFVVVGLPSRRSTTPPDAQPSVMVLEKTGDDWTATGRLRATEDDDPTGFGLEVAIDAGRIAVAMPGRNGADEGGRVAIYEREGSIWIRTQTIDAPIGVESAGFATAIAFSGDELVVGMPASQVGDVLLAGSARVYGVSDIVDCNGNGVDDADDIAGGTSQDCNSNGVPDECDIADGASEDRDFDGVPDECQETIVLDVPGAYPTIGDALAVARDGDVISIAAGVYTESLVIPAIGITLDGADGVDQTIIRAPLGLGATPALAITGTGTAETVVRDITFLGQDAARALEASNAFARFEQCRFGSGSAEFGGAASVSTSTVVFSFCLFDTSVAANDGGGLHVFGGSVTLEDSRVTANDAAEGAGVFLDAGAHTISRTTIDDNVATGDGGGVHVAIGTASTVILASEITANAAGTGGGVFVADGGPVVTLVDSTVCLNTPDDLSGPFVDGGGNDLCDCIGDLDGDGQVSGSDLTQLLASWGPCSGSCPPDFDGDGQVSGSDLTQLLAAWGPCS